MRTGSAWERSAGLGWVLVRRVRFLGGKSKGIACVNVTRTSVDAVRSTCTCTRSYLQLLTSKEPNQTRTPRSTIEPNDQIILVFQCSLVCFLRPQPEESISK